MNPFEYLQYHNCKDATYEEYLEKHQAQKGACSTFFSIHGQERPGLGHIATLVFTNRDFIGYDQPSQVIHSSLDA